MTTEQLKLFFISCEDEALRLEFEKHLGILESEEIFWFKNYSDYTLEQIHEILNAADFIGLLISPNFTSSYKDRNTSFHYIVNRAIQRQQEEICLVPIVMRSVHGWQKILNLQNIQSLPKDGKAVISRGRTKNDAFVSIAESLEELINEQREYKQKLQQFKVEAFELIQKVYPASDEVLEKLKEIQNRLNIRGRDTSVIYSQILKLKEESWRIYGEVVQKVLQHQHSITDETRVKLRKIQESFSLADREVNIIEKNIFQQYQVNQFKSQVSQSLSANPISENSSGLLSAIGIALVCFIGVGAIISGNQSKPPSFSSTTDTGSPSRNGQSSQTKGWIKLGTIDKPSGNTSERASLVDAVIEPSRAPLKGDVITATQDIEMWSQAGERTGVVIKAGERLVVLDTGAQVSDSTNSSPSVTKIWAIIHRCGRSCEN
jgi:hypothetical protein